MSEETADVRPPVAAPTADELLNRLMLKLAEDPELAPYLHYVVVPMQMVSAEKSLGVIRRVIKAFNEAEESLL